MKPYYQDESVTIYNADCRDVLPTMDKVDLVLTDPPYGMHKTDWDMEVVPVDSWLPTCRLLATTAVFTGIQGMHDYPKPDWVLAWVRAASTQRNGRLRGFSNWEPLLLYEINRLSNDVIQVQNLQDRDALEHPTTKPLKLMRLILGRLEGETILDPFMGSGTTLRAAKDLNRKAIGIELEERYCEIAANRMSQLAMQL